MTTTSRAAETRTMGRTDTSAPWSMLAEWAAAIVPLLAILTSLAVWFGFQIVNSRTRYFGIDPTVLGFSTSDFVLRSVSALIRPLIYLLLLSLVVISVHAGVRWLINETPGRPRVGTGLTAGSLLCIASGVGLVWLGSNVFRAEDLSDYSFGTHCLGMSLGRWWQPSVLPLGVVLVLYGVWLFRKRSDRTAPPSMPLWQRVAVVVTAVIVIVGIFWSFSLYATAAGALESHSYACHHFDKLPKVIVYSTVPLNLQQEDGLVTRRVGEEGSQYHWRYSGLRLLIRSDDKYFILPANWLGQDDIAIVLSDSPALRFEFSPGRL